MRLADFKDVHPNWGIIDSMSDAESHAALQLLFASLYADGQLTGDELEAATDIYAGFPIDGEPASQQVVIDLSQSTYEKLTGSAEDNDAFLASLCDEIDDPDLRVALTRLIAIVLTADGATEHEQEFFYVVAKKFDLELDTAEAILRAAWESHEESETIRRTGKGRHIPPIKGAGWARDRDLSSYFFPFQQRESERQEPR